MTWLITGGAGYIGGHITNLFEEAGMDYVCFDDFSSGIAARIPDKSKLFIGDIRDPEAIDTVIDKFHVTGVIHLAAKKSVQESQINPDLYSEVNFRATQQLLNKCISKNVRKFLFSSSAAVYGENVSGFVKEEALLEPISPYGNSKMKAEEAIISAIKSEKIRGSSLRFFNVIGSKNDLLRDNSVDNLVPRVLNSLKINRRPQVFGNNYPTPDGTCIRDYLDVRDIAQLHLHLCERLETSSIPPIINVGTGKGISVLDVMRTLNSRLNKELEPEILPRREGDPSMLVADIKKMNQEVGYTTKYSFVDSIDSLFI